MTKPFMFLKKIKFNQMSCVHLHGLHPMHETNAFSTNHGNCRVPKTKHPPHCIEICLNIICHETFEVDIFYYAYLLNNLVREDHIKTCESTSSDCMSHTSIVNTLQYVMS